MTVFMHPSLLKKREEQIIIRESDLQLKKYLIDLQETQLRKRERDIKVIIFISFIAGIVLGSFLVFLLDI